MRSINRGSLCGRNPVVFWAVGQIGTRSGTQVKKQVGAGSAVWTHVYMQVFMEVSLQVGGQVAIPACAQARDGFSILGM